LILCHVIKRTEGFFIFTIIYVVVQYISNISFNLEASLLEPSQNKRISSTKSKWVKVRFLLNLNFFRDPILLDTSITLVIPSTTIDNNKGDKGNPCLSPFDGINNSDVDPLTCGISILCFLLVICC
jgi:hypothetical protein